MFLRLDSITHKIDRAYIKWFDGEMVLYDVVDANGNKFYNRYATEAEFMSRWHHPG